jgi:hypothetical protein
MIYKAKLHITGRNIGLSSQQSFHRNETAELLHGGYFFVEKLCILAGSEPGTE